MRAVIAPTPGGPDALQVVELPDPTPGPEDLVVDVVATAVNRADVLQRKGHYPPPPGSPDTLGLELSGTVSAIGSAVEGWTVGDEVCAVVGGGGYAEKAVVPASTAMPPPPGVDLISAAAVPTICCASPTGTRTRSGTPRTRSAASIRSRAPPSSRQARSGVSRRAS